MPTRDPRKAIAQTLADATRGMKDPVPAILINGLLAKYAKLAPSTRFNAAYSLKKLCTEIDARTGSKLAAEIPTPRRASPRQRIATEQELAALFEHADPPLRMFLALTSIMAFRFAEAEQIGWANYNAERQTIVTKTKGGKYREFPAPDQVRALIEMTPRGEGSFISLLNGRPLHHERIRARWEKLKAKAGVDADLHPHDLRRTAAVRVFRMTHDVFAAKQLLGHDSLASTAWYLTPHEPAALADAAKALREWTPNKHRQTPAPITRRTYDSIVNGKEPVQ